MESKVKEYQELYGEFERICEQISSVVEPIRGIEKEMKQIQGKQKKVDYNNPDIVVGYMETYMKEAIAKKKESIKNEVNERMEIITNSSGEIKENFDKAVKWFSKDKVDKFLRSADIDFEENIGGEKVTEFEFATVLNTVLAFLFRFDFLRFLPKVFRIIAGIIFWAIFLIPIIVASVQTRFGLKYSDYIYSLSGDEYEMALEQFAKKIHTSSVTSVIVTAIAIIVINIAVYFWARYTAKKFISDNKTVCLGIIDPNGLRQKMYDHSVIIYMEETVKEWKEEIESIKKNGLSENPGSNSLVSLVKNDLCGKYNVLEEKINGCKARIGEIQRQGERARTDLQAIIPEIKLKETEVDSLVRDSNHNNAVLSPYVSAGYSQYTIEGVKELVYFKHNYKPMLICYGNDTAKDGERFRKNAAKLIELFMSGFFQENYYKYINMWLVDFEGLYFPESRTKGLMKVMRTQQDVQMMLEELKNTREIVDVLADGRINNINPNRLANRENPIKYNIVYFVGYDFTTIDREISQLFIGGENFGFLPIVFMKQSLAQSMLNDDGSSRVFSRVVEKMRDNNQVYGFEGLVSEFEYDLMVSNQKKLLDEKLCVNKIMTMDEFAEAVQSDEGLDIGDIIYIDTYQLAEDIYKGVEDMDYVKLFTVNGEIPEFVTKDIIRL